VEDLHRFGATDIAGVGLQELLQLWPAGHVSSD
jgi:hypothetical protein